MAVMTVLLFKTVKNHATYVLMVSRTTGSLLLILSIYLLKSSTKIKITHVFNYKIVIWNHAVIIGLLLFANPSATQACVIVVPLVNVAKPAKNANGKYCCIHYIKNECIKIMVFTITIILQTDRITLLKFQMFKSRRIYWTMNGLILIISHRHPWIEFFKPWILENWFEMI